MAFLAPLILSSLVLFVTLFLFYTVQWVISTRRPQNFPPGPPTTLGFGNIHQLSPTYLFLQFDEWAKEYGPIFGFKAGPQNIVVLNDAALVHEMIVKQGAQFSARPSSYIAQEHVLHDAKHIYSLFLNNDYSKRLRSLTKPIIAGAGLSRLVPMQKAAGTRLVCDLIESGDDWMDHIMQWGISTPAAMLSGAPIQDFDKAWVNDYHFGLDLMEELLDATKSPPVDNFPILRWVPSIFAEWKRKAPRARKVLLNAHSSLMDQAKKERQGSFQALIPQLLRESKDPSTMPKERLSEHEIKMMMGGMLDAAVDSSVVTTQILLYALASHPDIQRRAQAEIDAVFGSETAMPDKIDLDKLPYLNACVNEGLRWRPVGPLALPRGTLADVNILGYRIPKGTTVMINVYTIGKDPEFYDEPDRYIPERYIRDPLGLKDGVSQPGRKPLYAFGAGRRECPGKDFFFQNASIMLAQLLWACNIVPAGPPLETEIKKVFVSALLMRPKNFKIKFVPRRQGTQEALLEEKQKAEIMLTKILG